MLDLHCYRRLFFLSCVCLIPASIRAAEKVDYVRDVKPLLKHCYSCHGALRQQSGLRLDTAAAMQRGGESGAAIVPGKSAESLLIHAITGTSGASRMPPEDEAAPLTAEAIETIRNWIDQGAEAPAETEPTGPREHWSFRLPVRPALPSVTNTAWPRTPIDHFVLAEQERRGLKHAPEAARNVLLRRVYLDLIGLPPTREELHAFLADDSPLAYEKIVERLLDSPQYGERWGRHWMDVWRYSDWAGYGAEIRESQYHIWRWRDWIVESLNGDRPYDQMIVEMVAGDEVAPTDPGVLRATGYLGRNWFRYNRNVWLDNTVEHCGKAFLGLTFNCARCHDHKYDPISQAEYYQMRAVFEPYDVRYDRLPGQSDVTKDGIARVYDKQLETATFVFIRGNEATPDKEHPQPPKTPEFFASKFAPTPVTLPVESFYPALTESQVTAARLPLVEAIAAVEKELEQATSAAQGAKTKLDQFLAAKSAKVPDQGVPAPTDEKQTLEKALTVAESELKLAAKKLDVAKLALVSFDHRVAAARSEYGITPNSDRKKLAQTASKSEYEATRAKAELDLLLAERKLAQAKEAMKEEDQKSKKAVSEAQTQFDAATKAHETAKQAHPAESEKYAALGEIYPQTSTGRRLALARWITSPENPLTARVAINHIWLRHFGRPLVSTVFDFGINGKAPSHPELLDWLSVELASSGWRMKHIHRLIVLSATYRQSSQTTEFSSPPAEQLKLDPENQYLWKMNARRLEAEIVRDSLLSIGGSLDARFGGPEIDHQQGQNVSRRSIYFRHAKEKEMVFTKLFDGPGVSECYQRDESVVPQQALALANSPLAKNQSRLLARALSQSEDCNGDEPFIVAMFEQIVSRRPTADEIAVCREFLTTQTQLFADPKKLTTASTGEPGTISAATDPAIRARENLVHVMLNHHDFVTIR